MKIRPDIEAGLVDPIVKKGINVLTGEEVELVSLDNFVFEIPGINVPDHNKEV